MPGSGMRRAALAATAVLLAFPIAARAQEAPVTIGPDLSQYADTYQAGCSSEPFSPSPLAASTCTWTSASAQVVPGSGTISQVSVKTGPVSGPMKVVIMRIELELAASGGAEPALKTSCCVDVAESEAFTPTAGSITTVPVDLPVELASNPLTHALTVDLVGLSVLEGGVPVPVAAGVQERAKFEAGEEGEGPTETEAEKPPKTFVEEPALQDDGRFQRAQEGKGDLLLMDAVWQPAPGTRLAGAPGLSGSRGEPEPEPSTPQPSGAATGPAIAFSKRAARVRDGDALVPLRCTAATACRGVVSLQSASFTGGARAALPDAGVRAALASTGTRRARKRARVVTYATGDFGIAAHGSKLVALRLSRAGRKLASARRRAAVWINVTVSSSTPPARYSHAFELGF
jgi:hypothetical protein